MPFFFDSSEIYIHPHTSNEIWTLAQVDIQLTKLFKKKKDDILPR